MEERDNRVSSYIEDKLLLELDKFAENNDLTRSQAIRLLVKKGLNYSMTPLTEADNAPYAGAIRLSA